MVFKSVRESDFGFHQQTFQVHLHYVLCHGLLWTERLLELMPEQKTGETRKPKLTATQCFLSQIKAFENLTAS